MNDNPEPETTPATISQNRLPAETPAGNWISVPAAAVLANRSTATMRRYAASGRVKAQKIGKTWIVDAGSAMDVGAKTGHPVVVALLINCCATWYTGATGFDGLAEAMGQAEDWLLKYYPSAYEEARSELTKLIS